MKAYKEIVNRYYKYVTETFSSGNAGSVTGYHWHTRDGWYGAYYTCANPTVLKSVNITIGWTDTASFQQGLVCNLQAQGSNDYSTWTTIKNWGDRSGRGTSHVLDCSENTTAYKYFRFYAENGGWESNDSCDVASVEYVGTDTVVQEVTAEDDYDFIVEGGAYYVPVINDTYYAVKSYEKGQYYGN